MSNLKNPIATAQAKASSGAASAAADKARALAQAKMPVPLAAKLPTASELSAAAIGGRGQRWHSAGDTWRDRLYTACWRGFYFMTDSHEAKGGWRLAVHELPGGDMPVVENLGAQAPGWQLSAYFVGKDYDVARDAFLGLLNTPGAAWLQHPWLGMLWAHPHTWSTSESNDRQGYAVITVQFVPGGVLPSEPVPDLFEKARGKLSRLVDESLAQYDLKPMSATALGAMQAAVSAQLDKLRNLVAMATAPLAYATAAISMVQDLKGNLNALMALPGQYAAALNSMVNAVASLGRLDTSGLNVSRYRVGGGNATVRNVAQVAAAAKVAQAGGIAALVSDGNDTPAAIALRQNIAAEAGLRAQLLVAAAAELALADYASAEDRDTAQAAVVGAIDALLPTLPDALFQAALDTRTTLIAALQAQALAPTQTRALVAPLPSVVLAHRMGVDEGVLLTRNAVRHPLFVQGAIDA